MVVGHLEATEWHLSQATYDIEEEVLVAGSLGQWADKAERLSLRTELSSSGRAGVDVNMMPTPLLSSTLPPTGCQAQFRCNPLEMCGWHHLNICESFNSERNGEARLNRSHTAQSLV
jgi:hypothetical protein